MLVIVLHFLFKFVFILFHIIKQTMSGYILKRLEIILQFLWEKKACFSDENGNEFNAYIMYSAFSDVV